MIFIDSHCHLFYEGLIENLENKIKIAKLNDVKYLLSVGTSESNFESNLEISKNFDNVCCSVGIHPHEYTENYSMDFVKSFLTDEKVVAIGEVGLDYHYEDSTPKTEQKKLFRDMLSLSKESDLPYIIHARECFPDVFGIMKEYDIKNAVFHCYTDNIENAKKILDLGYYISFSGVITFKKSDELREILKYTPTNRLLLETDCPYLTPVPHRGKIIEPAYVREITEFAAGIKEVDIENFTEILFNNFFKLFPKAKFLLERNV